VEERSSTTPAEQRPTRQEAQRDLVERAQRTAGVAEALKVHDAIASSYMNTTTQRVAWMHYGTGGNQT
jgi:hypothetical protein